ncbi:aromatic acid exporter family protein [Paenibacillus sp. YYML68]|uniref:FUSC family protein n=1 Tax=Paenibacillus sp. YYML68 TaxID=2909250 RepID=UPI002493AF75|nr:aromatic acid exporter family protein [Paenibacillus sp. YYML68]
MLTRLAIGNRLIKTGVAIFATSAICHWMNWPTIFAIIAAIVTLEPTVDASVRKGFIRFPAAITGAAVAMAADYALGQQPLAYTLSALATIYLCQLLKWKDALLVATLTSVNMIALTESDYLQSFFVRVGTTLTGITVSALVNYFIFPPDYSKQIESGYSRLTGDTQATVRLAIATSLGVAHSCNWSDSNLVSRQEQINQIRQTLTFIAFQLADCKYRRMQRHKLKRLLRIRLHMTRLLGLLDVTEELCRCSRTLSPEQRQALWQRYERAVESGGESEQVREDYSAEQVLEGHDAGHKYNPILTLKGQYIPEWHEADCWMELLIRKTQKLDQLTTVIDGHVMWTSVLRSDGQNSAGMARE